MNEAQAQIMIELLGAIAKDLADMKQAMAMDVKNRSTRLEDIQRKLGTLELASKR